MSQLIDDPGAAARLVYALQECLRSAVASIRAHGLRSLLTMLGVIIGVASVICVIGLVQGLSSSISSQFEGLGSSTLTLRSFTPLEDQLRGKLNRLRPSDLDELRFRVEGINNITPIVFAGQRFGAEVRYGSNTANGQLFGTTNRYQDVAALYPRVGRFLTESDDISRRRVAVLGEQMRKDLKLPNDPTGQFVQIGREWFKVVGSMEARGEVFGQSQDNFLVMPYETALAVTGVITEPDLWISFSVTDLDNVANVKQQVIALIRRVHAIGEKQPDDFVVEGSDTLANTFKTISSTVTAVVAGIVSISLLVGGIGIMNIMLVSVTERTREIGIAKALGAPRHFILLQFLIEAVLLATLGGIVGVVLGFLLAFGVASLIPNFPAPNVPWWAVVGACLFSALVGVLLLAAGE